MPSWYIRVRMVITPPFAHIAFEMRLSMMLPSALCISAGSHVVMGLAPGVDGTLPLVPRYTATMPNYEKPNGGLRLLAGAEHYRVFAANPQTGTYNHQPMLAWHGGALQVLSIVTKPHANAVFWRI